MDLKGRFSEGIDALTDNFNSFGLATIGIFVAAWIVLIVIYRYRGLDDLEGKAD